MIVTLFLLAWLFGTWAVGWVLAKILIWADPDQRDPARGLWVLSPTGVALLVLAVGAAMFSLDRIMNADASRFFRWFRL